jgi:hypothetical protein
VIQRSNASALLALGQFGAAGYSPWQAQSGFVQYDSISIPQLEHLELNLRYSKHSPSSVPILVYVDNEPDPRASFIPVDLGDWNSFAWSEQIDLGKIGSGAHSLRFFTAGQQYGVADLDMFTLTAGP